MTSINYQNDNLKLAAISPGDRPGRRLVVMVFFLAWLTAVLWLGAAVYLLIKQNLYGLLILSVDAVFVFYLARSSLRLYSCLRNQYIVEVVDERLHFFELDESDEIKRDKSLSVNEIRICEHYPYQDSGSVVLKTETGSTMEIPVWCLPEKGRPLFDYLRSHGVEVINVND